MLSFDVFAFQAILVFATLVSSVILSSCVSVLLSVLLFHRHFKSVEKVVFAMFLMAMLMSANMLYILVHRKNARSGTALISSLRLSFSKKESEYLELRNQINPHFLFNNISMMISFIETQPQKAIDFGHHLAGVYRHYMNNNIGDFSPLQDELSFVKGYLEIYKAKFDDSFSFEIVGDAKNFYVLSSVLQELIDNAFKHNLHSEESPLHMTFAVDSDTLSVSNRVNRREVSASGKGLVNIKRRYKLLTGQQITVSEADGFFTVTIPLFAKG